MDARNHSPNVRTGRFLWMEEKAKKRYLAALEKRIAEGYFSSDRILAGLVDEIAPVFNEYADVDVAAKTGRALLSR